MDDLTDLNARLDALEQAEAILSAQQQQFERALHAAELRATASKRELFEERQKAREKMMPTSPPPFDLAKALLDEDAQDRAILLAGLYEDRDTLLSLLVGKPNIDFSGATLLDLCSYIAVRMHKTERTAVKINYLDLDKRLEAESRAMEEADNMRLTAQLALDNEEAGVSEFEDQDMPDTQGEDATSY